MNILKKIEDEPIDGRAHDEPPNGHVTLLSVLGDEFSAPLALSP